jgi:antitoxin CptB
MTHTDPAAHEARLKRLHYRAWHRGTREADYMIGGFFDVHHAVERGTALLVRKADRRGRRGHHGLGAGHAGHPAEYEGAMMAALKSWITSKFHAERLRAQTARG